MPGFGRLHVPDARDSLHPMRAIAEAEPAPSAHVPVKLYRRGPQLDQGKTSSCVGQSWRNWLAAAPVMTSRGPTAFDIYDAAILVDEFPDNDHDTRRQMGSSVRAGAKVLAGLGHVGRYVWATSIDDVLAWMLTGRGGVVLGVNWYAGMMDPTPEGIIRATGGVVGGHAIYAFGADEPAGMLLLHNSWGTAWGGWTTSRRRQYAGCARLPLEDVARLLAEDGEAATAVQVRVRTA